MAAITGANAAFVAWFGTGSAGMVGLGFAAAAACAESLTESRGRDFVEAGVVESGVAGDSIVACCVSVSCGAKRFGPALGAGWVMLHSPIPANTTTAVIVAPMAMRFRFVRAFGIGM